jgi:hypothetical protein
MNDTSALYHDLVGDETACKTDANREGTLTNIVADNWYLSTVDDKNGSFFKNVTYF